MEAVVQVLNEFLKFPLIYGRGTTITFDKRVFPAFLCDKEMNDHSIIKNLTIIWNVGGSRRQDFKYEKGETPKFESNARSMTPNGDFIFSSGLALFYICYIFLRH